MSSFYSDIQTDTRERIALSPGSYGTSTAPGLKIVQYIDKASKLDKTGSMRHSFLVSALRPSRESLASFQANKNGKDSTPLDSPDYEGTAFLSLTLNEMWLNPEAIALAFSEASRNKEGVVQHDYVAAAIESKEASEESISNARAHFMQIATDKVTNANTPAEQMEEKVQEQFRKELQQVAIKVGTFFRLLDWSGKERGPQADPKSLVGTEFSGKVEKSNVGEGSEVVAVYSKKAGS